MALSQPGDLDKLFERMVTSFDEYKPTIHAMPEPTSQSILKGPWVVTLDNFLTLEECNRLIDLGAESGYLVSMDIGTKIFDGSYGALASKNRTSTNSWCTDECYEDTQTKEVMKKIERITAIPEANSEFLQLLRYATGQFYRTHHDLIPYQVTGRQQGARIITVFLYLNDVEQGGGTNFPKLSNLTIMPKQGRALIWPSVLSEDPNIKDPRTVHQALPVEKGVKYGANAWLHQRDYKEAVERDCQ
jgi:prolyl 4-hydroxylase